MSNAPVATGNLEGSGARVKAQITSKGIRSALLFKMPYAEFINSITNKDQLRNPGELSYYLKGTKVKKKRKGKTQFLDKNDKILFEKIINDTSKNGIFKHFINIPKENINKAENGEKVLVEIESWPEKAGSPYGNVIKVLGKPGEHNTEIHSILAQFGLPYEFEKEVEDYISAYYEYARILKDEIGILIPEQDAVWFYAYDKKGRELKDKITLYCLQKKQVCSKHLLYPVSQLSKTPPDSHCQLMIHSVEPKDKEL